jgi:hypothetical protein
MSLKHTTAAMALVLASTFASAQQAPPPKPDQLPATNWALAVTLVFGASFYFYLECLTGNCRPVPCWMTATCKG